MSSVLDDTAAAYRTLRASQAHQSHTLDVGMPVLQVLAPHCYQECRDAGVTDDDWVRLSRQTDGTVLLTVLEI